MPFEDRYTSADEIPSAVKHLYKQVGDEFVIVGASEFKTVQDVANVQEGLRKDREDHKTTKTRLAKFNSLDPDEVFSKLDRFAELEAAAAGAIDEEKLNGIVENRIGSKTAPLMRQIETLTAEREQLAANLSSMQENEKRRVIHDHIRSAARDAKLRDTAVDDALLMGERIFDVDETGSVITRDGVGVTPGVGADVWLTDVKQTRPHWWPESKGANANGSSASLGGTNPFSKDGWNLTEQGRMLRESPAKAQQMAQSAGTTVGGKKPT